MPKVSTVPEKLRPYFFYGMDLQYREGDANATAQCPFCDREGKFSVKIESGQWRCLVCNKGRDTGKSVSGGNTLTFLEEIHTLSLSTTSDKDYTLLGKNRKLLQPCSTLRYWGVCKSVLSGEWLLPGYSLSGRIRQLYRYTQTPLDKQYRLFAAPGMGHWMSGIPLLDPRVLSKGKTGKEIQSPEILLVCEGVWDGICLWETLLHAKPDPNDSTHFLPTSNPSLSILKEYGVLSVPSCNTFEEGWLPLFAGKKVVLLYDNDHPKYNPKTKTWTESAGYAGMKRVAQLLSRAEEKPSSVHYLQWSSLEVEQILPSLAYANAVAATTPTNRLKQESSNGKVGTNGHVQSGVYFPQKKATPTPTSVSTPANVGSPNLDENTHHASLPSGFDVRDLISSGGDISGRLSRLSLLLQSVQPMPSDWIKGVPPNSKGKVELEMMPCEDWRTLALSWKVAMAWTDGLDCALSVMLACIISTKGIGEQLWAKIIGCPSCLDGDTPIYDPLNATELTVRERWERGESFYVWSLHPDGKAGVRRALPPRRFLLEEIYEVELGRGQKIRVTAGHRFWDGSLYVSTREIMEAMAQGRDYYLPTYSYQTHMREEGDKVVSITPVGKKEYYDFHVPETNNYWACGLFHHNSGKSTLCEALSVNRKYVLAKSTIRGFHSGFDLSGTGQEDNSLIAQLKNKTLVTKDGDTLLQSPNLSQILAEARDLYDRTSRTHYRNKAGRDYSGVNLTWILCGTSSLRALDSSELGERFLDCVIMDWIDEDLEDKILWRVAHRTARNMEAAIDDGTGKTKKHGSLDPDMLKSYQLTGGYIEHLCKNVVDLVSRVKVSDDAIRECIMLGKLVAYMRARPSRKQDETAEREFAARLVSQMVRLAKCLGAVLNKDRMDEEVMRRVRKVALDTARGRTMDITRILYRAGREGMTSKTLAHHTSYSEDREKTLLRFLRRIRVVEPFNVKNPSGYAGATKWRLTKHLLKLFAQVFPNGFEGGVK